MLNTKTQKVAFNTIIQIVGKIIVTAISLITVASLTRYLGVTGFGEYTTIFAFVSFWAVIADFGFFWVLLRELSKPDCNKDDVFNYIFSLKIIFCLVIFLVSGLSGFLIPQYSWNIKIGIAIISASWVWMSFNTTYVALFQSQLEMYKATISEIIGRLFILAGVILSVKNNYSFQIILYTYVLGNFINYLASLAFGQGIIKYKFKYDLKYWKFVLIEGFPLAMLSIIGVLHSKIDAVLLSIFKGSLDVGIYGVPYKILEIIILVPTIFIGNTFPIINKYFHAKDPRMDLAIQKSFNFLVMLAFPTVAGLIILAWPIINLVAGSEYLTTSDVTIQGINFPAPRILPILAISIGFSFILNIFSSLLVVMGKQYKQLVPMLVITIINIILNVIFIQYYSYVAASIVNTFTNMLMLIWWYILTKKYLDLRLDYRIILKVLFATIIMSIILYLLKDYNIFLTIIVGIVGYFVSAYCIKVFNWSEVMQFLPKLKSEEK